LSATARSSRASRAALIRPMPPRAISRRSTYRSAATTASASTSMRTGAGARATSRTNESIVVASTVTARGSAGRGDGPVDTSCGPVDRSASSTIAPAF
jgi:hypothetical protein